MKSNFFELALQLAIHELGRAPSDRRESPENIPNLES